jgi:hypothetical protein
MAITLAGAAQPGTNPLADPAVAPLVGLGPSPTAYLWHWPIGLWVDERSTGLDGPMLFALRCALTLAAALASYFLLELPIRRGRSVFRPSSGLAFVGVLGVLVIAGAFVVPIAVFPAKNEIPAKVALTKRAKDVSATYASAPRCDAPAATDPAGKSGESGESGPTPRVLLVGNSLAVEAQECLGAIMRDREAELTTIANFQVPLCDLQPRIDEIVADPATRPDVVVLFSAVAHDPLSRGMTEPSTGSWASARRGPRSSCAPSVPYVTDLHISDEFADGVGRETGYYPVLLRDPQHRVEGGCGAFVRTPTARIRGGCRAPRRPSRMRCHRHAASRPRSTGSTSAPIPATSSTGSTVRSSVG